MESGKDALREKMEEMGQDERIDLNVQTAIGIFKTLTGNKEMKGLTVEEKWKLLCEAQPEFTRCYPIVCFSMLDETFHPEIFRRWLYRLEKDPGKGMDGYCERQADYSMMLFKKRNTRWTPDQAKLAWDRTYNMLKSEQKSMESAEKNAREKQEIEKTQHNKELRDGLYKFIMHHKDDSK